MDSGDAFLFDFLVSKRSGPNLSISSCMCLIGMLATERLGGSVSNSTISSSSEPDISSLSRVKRPVTASALLWISSLAVGCLSSILSVRLSMALSLGTCHGHSLDRITGVSRLVCWTQFAKQYYRHADSVVSRHNMAIRRETNLASNVTESPGHLVRLVRRSLKTLPTC